ncbi:MAG: hypothetical protein K2M16_06985 [Muribaculaceae bacterium]|nr:hypothetical protein [Muribaculaceae bacterium]
MAAPERLLELQGVDYLNTLLMVDNYFPVFNQKECYEMGNRLVLKAKELNK